MSTDRSAGVTAPVQAAVGADALRLLEQEAFRRAWDALHSACPWATVFQGPAFALTWYRVYAPRYEPVVVHSGEWERGDLAGLLLLARERESGEMVHVGAGHAEYHGWLARPGAAATFPVEAFVALRPIVRGAPFLRFLFLAPGTPLDWVAAAERAGFPTAVRWHKRGLMRVGDGSEVQASLRKSGNKSRLARLRRIGPVSLDQLDTAAALEGVIDVIAEQCDVRQGGVHASLPFRSDPLKRELYLAMMAEPGLLHATVLRAGDRVVASHLSTRDPRGVPLGLITHAPEYAAHSPGKLLLLLLGRLLGEQGYEVFDLTPGGSYKDRFATHTDDVCVAEVYFDRTAYAAYRMRHAASAMVRRVEERTGKEVRPTLERGARLLRQLRRRRPDALVRSLGVRAGRWAHSDREFRIYRYALNGGGAPATLGRLSVNRLADLLDYSPAGPSDATLTEFLATAVERLEEGQIVFTYAEGGVLLHYSWLIPRARRVGSEFGHDIPTPEGPSVLWDDYTHPAARGRGLHQEALRARLSYAAAHELSPVAMIGVRADNAPSRHNIEKVGFQYAGSAWLSVRRGRARRWVTWEPGLEPAAGEGAAPPAPASAPVAVAEGGATEGGSPQPERR